MQDDPANVLWSFKTALIFKWPLFLKWLIWGYIVSQPHKSWLTLKPPANFLDVPCKTSKWTINTRMFEYLLKSSWNIQLRLLQVNYHHRVWWLIWLSSWSPQFLNHANGSPWLLFKRPRWCVLLIKFTITLRSITLLPVQVVHITPSLSLLFLAT